jgi:chemotaxis protein MotB
VKKKNRIEPADESFEQTFIALMLLLLCFMVIMVSLAQLEGPRFRTAIGSVKGALSMLSEASGSSMIQDKGPGVLPEKGGVGAGDATVRGEQVEQLKHSLEAMSGEEPEGMIRVTDTGSGLELTLGSLVLFERGRADLKDEAGPILQEIGDFLSAWPGRIKVVGHTCDLPIHTSRFPSNWDLSIARAVAVVHRLVQAGVPGDRLVAIGMGESRPLFPNDVEEHRALNRRVEILLEYAEEPAEETSPDAVPASEDGAVSEGPPGKGEGE